MSSTLRQDSVDSLREILKPLVQLLIELGLSYRDLSEVAKEVFVEVALLQQESERQSSNVSRISAITGISRKQIAEIRGKLGQRTEVGAGRLWRGQLNPASETLHFWHHDPDFVADSAPIALPFDGEERCFAQLVKRYFSDIPPSAVRDELLNAGAVKKNPEGLLFPVRPHFTPIQLDSGFVRSAAFSLANLISTIVHNAKHPPALSDGELPGGRVERYVWSRNLSDQDVRAFKALASERASTLLEDLDIWIGERELKNLRQPSQTGSRNVETTVGLGIYYFEGSTHPDN